MLVFGGFEDGERTNEVCLYSIQKNVWSKTKQEHGALPCARSGHAATFYRGAMYVFGGKADNDRKLNDLWTYSLAKQVWQ